MFDYDSPSWPIYVFFVENRGTFCFKRNKAKDVHEDTEERMFAVSKKGNVFLFHAPGGFLLLNQPPWCTLIKARRV